LKEIPKADYKFTWKNNHKKAETRIYEKLEQFARWNGYLTLTKVYY